MAACADRDGLPICTSQDRCPIGVTLGAGGLFVEVAGAGLSARALPYPLVASTLLICDWKREQSRWTTTDLDGTQGVVYQL